MVEKLQWTPMLAPFLLFINLPQIWEHFYREGTRVHLRTRSVEFDGMKLKDNKE